jgi:hypothetical protein
MKRNTSRVLKHNLIRQRALTPAPGRKSYMRDREVFFLELSQYHLFSMVDAIYIIFYAPPPLVNLRARFLLRGEGCNTLCYGFPNYLH